MRKEETFSVCNQTKIYLPALPIIQIKEEILGKDYSLSLAFVTETKSREINKKYRGKNKPANVLSFSLRQNEGEIVVCPAMVRKQAKSFGKNFRQFLGFLVIHGMLHLKGMKHSSTMEKAEKKYDQKYFYRNRRGVLHNEGRRGRVRKGGKKS